MRSAAGKYAGNSWFAGCTIERFRQSALAALDTLALALSPETAHAKGKMILYGGRLGHYDFRFEEDRR